MFGLVPKIIPFRARILKQPAIGFLSETHLGENNLAKHLKLYKTVEKQFKIKAGC